MPTRRFSVREELRRSAGLDRPEVLCIRGRLQPDLRFLPIRCYSTTHVRQWPEGSPAVLELLDGDGEVVNTGPVRLEDPVDHEDSRPYQKLCGYVALVERATTVRLRVDGVAAWEREIPGAATVSVEATRATRTGKVNLTIEHSAVHDGAHLGVVLQWGPRRFRTIGVFEPTERMELDLSDYPGSDESRIVVHYSNGVRSASAATDTFELEPLAPEITVVEQNRGARRNPYAPVDLVANVIDHQRPRVADADIQWLADGEVVGTGRVLTLEGLDVGDVEIEARYRPDDRTPVTDTCRVRIDALPRGAGTPGCRWDEDHE